MRTSLKRKYASAAKKRPCSHVSTQTLGMVSQTHNDKAHEPSVLLPGSPNGRKQEEDGQRNDDDGELELDIGSVEHDNDKLHREAEEEEKVKLEQSDKNLICQVAALHADVGGDVLVDAPRKLVVELPADDGHEDGAEGEDAGNRNQERLDLRPDFRVNQQVLVEQPFVGFLDLVDLDGTVDEESEVEEAEPDDLDRVFQAERIVDEADKEDVRKDEEREVSGTCQWFSSGSLPGCLRWYCAGLGWDLGPFLHSVRHIVLESGKHEALKAQHQQRLDDGDAEEGPAPARVGDVHHRERSSAAAGESCGDGESRAERVEPVAEAES